MKYLSNTILIYMFTSLSKPKFTKAIIFCNYSFPLDSNIFYIVAYLTDYQTLRMLCMYTIHCERLAVAMHVVHYIQHTERLEISAHVIHVCNTVNGWQSLGMLYKMCTTHWTTSSRRTMRYMCATQWMTGSHCACCTTCIQHTKRLAVSEIGKNIRLKENELKNIT